MLGSRAAAQGMGRQALVGARGYARTGNASYYNRRFKPAHGTDPNYFSFVSKLLPAGAAERTRTERDPAAYGTESPLRLAAWEARYLLGDFVHQLRRRAGRSNDLWTRALGGYALFAWLMAGQALLWKVHFLAAAGFLYTRVRDKAMPPQVDEVALLDALFASPPVRALFSPETYHVIDFHQEFDAGRDAARFPDYDTPAARFFNVDCNTTSGFYKLGDLETGATMHLAFKTMPFADNRYNLSEPFLLYDLRAEINHDGAHHVLHLVKEEDVLASKSIFVVWH